VNFLAKRGILRKMNGQRAWAAILALLTVAMVWATPTDETDPARVRPDVFIHIRPATERAAGVMITVGQENYPVELLSQQINQLASSVNSPLRGLQILEDKMDTRADVRVLRATMGIDNLITQSTGIVELEPIARAFTGAPEPHRIRSIMVTVEKFRAGFNALQELPTGAVRVRGVQMQDPEGVEYRILLLTQDPNQVVIPRMVEASAPAKPRPAPSGPDLRIVLLTTLAVLAGGGLVYFLVPRRGR
jgi:hypothetical protein